MKKALLKRLLIALMILLVMSGCAAKQTNISGSTAAQDAEPTAHTQLQQAKENLLQEFYEMLEVNEQLYSGIFRCLEYMEEYAQTLSWDSLLKARASAGAALVAIRQMELPSFDLTAEEMDLLQDAGIGANDVQREFEFLESARSSMADTATLLSNTLEQDVFMKASVEDAIPAMAEFYREYFTLEYRYMCLFANYILIQMDSEGSWQLWTQQLPCMAACAGEWCEETTDAEAATGKILDEMQALQSRMGSFLGVSEFTMEIVQEAVETGNLEPLQREINVNMGVPGYFPVPEWLPDVVHIYLVTDPANQEKRLVTSAEELNSIPSACYLSCGEIDLENVTAYEEQLQQWEIEAHGTWNDSKDTWQLLAKSGNSTMMIEWKENETLLYLTEPIGCLIPELYLYAMNMK